MIERFFASIDRYSPLVIVERWIRPAVALSRFAACGVAAPRAGIPAVVTAIPMEQLRNTVS
ncbi:MAG: hypothetical protein H6978_03435 [Gammaproteobacteria bacterium]|nr:hypothetical protein [Gammaproteobacteria bacterium]